MDPDMVLCFLKHLIINGRIKHSKVLGKIKETHINDNTPFNDKRMPFIVFPGE